MWQNFTNASKERIRKANQGQYHHSSSHNLKSLSTYKLKSVYILHIYPVRRECLLIYSYSDVMVRDGQTQDIFISSSSVWYCDTSGVYHDDILTRIPLNNHHVQARARHVRCSMCSKHHARHEGRDMKIKRQF